MKQHTRRRPPRAWASTHRNQVRCVAARLATEHRDRPVGQVIACVVTSWWQLHENGYMPSEEELREHAGTRLQP